MTQPAHGTLIYSASSGSYVYTPASGYVGTDSFTYTVNDGLHTSAAATVRIAVTPSVPVSQGHAYYVTTARLDVDVTNGVLKGATEPNGKTLTASLVSNPSHGSLVLNSDGSFSYTPASGYTGPDSFTYKSYDGTAWSSVATVNLGVAFVNQAPSFVSGSNVTVNEDAASQTVSGWATSLSAGPSNESTQSLDFLVTNNNNSLFSVQPTISSSGTLTFTPAANAFGAATVTVRLHDDGGTANGGSDTSAAQTFTIAITAVNDPPSYTVGDDQTLDEDSGLQTIAGWASNISAGPANESDQTLTFHVTNDNAALFSTQPSVSANGTLTFASAANAFGTATVTVTLQDSGGGDDTSTPQTFTITVNSANDAPTFTKGADISLNEGAAAQSIVGWATNLSVGPSNESGQSLNFEVANDNNSLFSEQPTISADGTLSFLLAPGANGVATVSVRLHDDGGTDNGGVDLSDAQTFTITVHAVNSAPVFDAGGDPYVLADSGAQTYNAWATHVAAGPQDEGAQTLTFHVIANDNASLFSVAPSIAADGSLTFTPAAGAVGTATITISLEDNGGTANGGVDTSAQKTFTITVLPNRAGLLDPSFGALGKVQTSFFPSDERDQFSDSFVQADGKIILSGTTLDPNPVFTMARYNVDGSLDTTFGVGGIVRLPFDFGAGGNDYAEPSAAVVQLSNGKIILGGFAGIAPPAGSGSFFDYALARFNSDGSLDTTFGDGGESLVSLGSTYNNISKLVVLSDDKLMAYGNDGFIRFNADGSLDTSFGTGGHGGTFSMFSSVASLQVQDDGKLVVFGTGSDSISFTVARYNQDGTLDTSFGSGGSVTSHFDGSFTAEAGAIQSGDGKLVIVGQASITGASTGPDFAVARYNTDGTLDTGFGNGGLVLTDLGGSDVAYDVAIGRDGKIVVAGSSAKSNGSGGYGYDRFAVARYDADGTLDSTFANSGTETFTFGADGDIPSRVMIQPSGDILVAGVTRTNPEPLYGWYYSQFAMARIFGDSPVTSGLPNVNVSEDAAPTVLDVSSYFQNPADRSAALTYSLVGTPGPMFSSASIDAATGVLTLNYAPDANGTATLTVRASNPFGYYIDTPLTIHVTDVNDAPVLVGASDFATIAADAQSNPGQLVSDISTSTDVDVGALSGIAITAASATGGTWQYAISTDGGVTWGNWIDLGTVSGTSATLLKSTDKLRLLADGTSGATGSISFQAWDQTLGTAGTSANTEVGPLTTFSSSTATSHATVSAVDATLTSALQSLEYVRDNVSLELYFGQMKGAQATGETMAGNAWDQAAYLASLLNASGISTQLVSGTIEVDAVIAARWVGAVGADGSPNVAVAQTMLTQAGLLTNVLNNGLTFEIRHAWVRATINGNPYDFDPSWKFESYQAGVSGILDAVPWQTKDASGNPLQYTGLEQSYSSVDPSQQTALEFYEDKVTDYLTENDPGLTLADVPHTGTIIRQNLLAPPTYDYFVANVLNASSTFADSEQHKITIELKRDTQEFWTPQTYNTADIALKGITIQYSQTGSTVTPHLMLDGVDTLVGTFGYAANNDLTVVITNLDPNASGTTTTQKSYIRESGQDFAVGLDAQQVSTQQLERQQEWVTGAVLNFTPGTDPTAFIRAELAYSLSSYWFEFNRQSELITGLTNAVYVNNNVSSGLATNAVTGSLPRYYTQPDVQYVDVPSRLGLDLPNLQYFAVPLDGSSPFYGDSVERAHLIAYNSSALEGQIVQQITNANAISTVQGLYAAVQSHSNDIVTFAPGVTEAFIRNTLQYSNTAFEDQVVQAVNNHYVVTVPKHEVTIGTPGSIDSWTGEVYFETFAAADSISLKAIIFDGLTAAHGSQSSGPPLPVSLTNTSSPFIYNSAVSGDPIDVASGDVTHDEVDFAIPDFALSLSFSRHYDSSSTVDRGLGVGWLSNYSDWLTLGSSQVIWNSNDGHTYTFTYNSASGTYNTPAALAGTLTKFGHDYAYTDSSGISRWFHTPDNSSEARLERITDRNGNELIVDYDTSGRISGLKDPQGTNIEAFTYLDASSHISSITDFTGRVWTYGYMQISDGTTTRTYLTQVTGPAGSNLVTRYTYISYSQSKLTGGLLNSIERQDTTNSSNIVSETTYFTYYPDRRGFRVTDGNNASTWMSYDLYRSTTYFIDEQQRLTTSIYDPNKGFLLRQVNADRTRDIYTWDSSTYEMMSHTDEVGDKETYAYDANHNLAQIVNLGSGTTTNIAYTPINETDISGASITFYDVLSRAVLSGGAFEITNYQHDTYGNVTRITDATDAAGGSSKSMHYGPRGELLWSVDADGNMTSYTYTRLGLVDTMTNAAGGTTKYSYDDQGNLLSVTDPLGLKTQYTYDVLGRVLTQTTPEIVSGDPLSASMTRYVYDAFGNVVSMVDPRGAVTTYSYDKDNRKTSTQFSDKTVETYTYDLSGNLTRVTDRDGNTTQYVYDAHNRIVSTVYDDSSTTFTHYDAEGRVTAQIDARGNETANVYDMAGRLVSTLDALGDKVVYTYDGFGNRTSELHYAPGSSTPYKGSHYTYDSLNRLIESRGPDGDFETIVYDANGNVSQTIKYDLTGYTFDASGVSSTLKNSSGATVTLASLPSAAKRVTTYAYDALNRLTKVTDPILAGASSALTELTNYDADGRVTSTTDERGLTTTYRYDAAGRRTEITIPHATDPNAPGQTTLTAYDANGNVTSVTDPLGIVTSYTYDSNNRKLSQTVTDPSGVSGAPMTTWYAYDGLGNLVSTTDPTGQVTTYRYDDRNRLVAMDQPAPGGDEGSQRLVTTYQYDANGNMTQSTDALGRTTNYVYDALNRVVATTIPNTDADSFSVQSGGPGVGQYGEAKDSYQYSWDFGGLPSGTYRIYASWDPTLASPSYPAVATNATYSVYDGAKIADVTVNQQLEPNGPVMDGQLTQEIGTFEINNGTLTVRLDTSANGSILIGQMFVQSIPSTHTTYDADGNVISSTDPLGHLTQYEYDHHGRMTNDIEPDPDGSGDLTRPTTHFAYNSLGELVTKTFLPNVDDWSENNVTTYTYDNLGRVISETAPPADPNHPELALVTDTEYDADGNVTKVSVHTVDNSMVRVTTYSYDRLNRKVQEADADSDGSGARTGATQGWTYDANGNIVSTTDSFGAVKRYVYDGMGRKIYDIAPDAVSGLNEGAVTTYSYDLAGRLLSVTDALGNVTAYAYDALGRKVRETQPDPDGSGDLPAPVTEYAYDAVGNLLSKTDIVTINGAQKSRVTSYVYDSQNRMISQTLPSPDDGATAGATTRWTYDLDGNVHSKTDAEGSTVFYTYDALGRVLTESMPTQIVDNNSSDFSTTGTWSSPVDGGYGGTLVLVDNGSSSDTATWVAHDLPPGNYEISGTWLPAYFGNIPVSSTAVPYTIKDGDTVLYTWSPSQAASPWSFGDAGSAWGDLGTFYISSGTLSVTVAATPGVVEADAIRIAFSSTPIAKTYTYDSLGNVASVTDALGNVTSYAYDKLGDKITQTDPDPDGTGSLTPPVTHDTYDAFGNLTSVVDPMGNTTSYTYDAVGNRITETDPDPDGSGSLSSPVTHYTYDTAGNQTSVVAPAGNVTTYTYDKLNRLVAETNSSGSMTYRYDDLNRVVEQVDRDGRAIVFAYDHLGRKTAEFWYTDGTLTTLDHYQSYVYGGDGIVASETDSTGGATSYAYDALGRVLTEIQSFANEPSVAFDYTYDSLGNVLSRTDLVETSHGSGTFHEQSSQHYVYDGRYNLIEVLQDVGSTAPARVDFRYDALNRKVLETRYADAAGTQLVMTIATTFDNLSRVTSIIAKDASAAILDSYGYTYDADSRVTTQTTLSDGTTTYTYDHDGQLTASSNTLTSAAAESYAYDAAGNRVTDAGTANAIGDDNELNSDGTFTYTYDDAGNRLTRTRTSSASASDYLVQYVWDNRNRLVAVIDKDNSGNTTQTVTYTYDTRDRRTSETVTATGQSAVTTHFVYAGGSQIAMVFDGSGALTARYLYGPATDEILAEENATSGAINWQVTDRQQSVRDVVTFSGASATVADHLAYNAYGELVTETQPTVAHRFGYTGQEYDASTGLYYYNARYYDQAAGRFISVDPSGFSSGDVNLYRYVRDNPISFIDPTGLHIETADDEQGSKIVLGLNTSPQTFQPLAVAGPVTLGGQTVSANSYSSGGYSSAINTSSILSGFATPSSFVGPISSTPTINLGGVAAALSSNVVTTGFASSSWGASLASLAPTSGASYQIVSNSALDAATDSSFGSAGVALRDATTRASGGIQAVGGIVQTVGAYALGAASLATGPGALLGIPVASLIAAKGIDNASTGLIQLLTGQSQESAFVGALQEQLGLSKANANIASATIDILSSGLNSKGISAGTYAFGTSTQAATSGSGFALATQPALAISISSETAASLALGRTLAQAGGSAAGVGQMINLFAAGQGQGNQNRQPVQAGEVTTYADAFARRDVGDNLSPHEIWQNVNLQANGLAPYRLSTPASQNNPVMNGTRAVFKRRGVNAFGRRRAARSEGPRIWDGV